MEHLELLELYDNMVDELRELDGGEKDGDGVGLPGRNLRVLDISYNVIRDMGPVSLCPNLQELCELLYAIYCAVLDIYSYIIFPCL